MAAITTEPPQVLRPAGSVSRVVAAEPHHLYAWVADVTRTPEWSPETRRCTWLGDERGGGRPLRGVQPVRDLALDPAVRGGHRRPGAGVRVPHDPGRTGRRPRRSGATRFEPVEGGTRVTHSYEMVRRMPLRQQRAAAVALPRHRDRRPDMARSLDRVRRPDRGPRRRPPAPCWARPTRPRARSRSAPCT